MSSEVPESAERLRMAVHAFVRGFGLFDDSRTPCGQPLPTSHAHALMELLREPGLMQQELAERLGLTKSGTSRLLAGLEAGGRVVRRGDEGDSRVRRVFLTERGTALARTVERTSLLRFTALLDGIPAARRADVIECLDLLLRATPAPEERQE